MRRGNLKSFPCTSCTFSKETVFFVKKVQPCNPCVRAAFQSFLYFLHFFPVFFYKIAFHFI
jgi:hypothetical protein